MDELFEYSDILNAPFQAFSGSWKDVRPHWHYFTEMVYLVKGKLLAEVGKNKYTMTPGDMIIFHPKQIHSFLDYDTTEENSELLFYVIKFDEMILSNTTPGSPKLPKLLDNATNLDTPYNLITAEELQYNPVKLFFENCIWETKHKEFGYDIKVASTISLIVTEIMRIWLRKGFKFSTKTTFDQFSTKDFSVLEYIDKHSSENINIENLANMCGMCYSNFAKQFKAQFGKTCKEYIEFVRICKADTLLLYTDKTLDYISQETGFTDSSHFIRTYKKIKGITPKQRRQKQL
ncbi:MAG: helix-turn-helix domain-containing protein [Treponema sp.]|nr:helix-turn-helix domain-containing protein [Treponema sp.]MBQ8776864.1 helix-turn-helix domain-containing protein [Treponema sp.]